MFTKALILWLYNLRVQLYAFLHAIEEHAQVLGNAHAFQDTPENAAD